MLDADGRDQMGQTLDGNNAANRHGFPPAPYLYVVQPLVYVREHQSDPAV